MQDVITSNRLDDLWENQQVPTLEAVQRQFTKETSDKQQELFAIAMKQWQTENTQLYFLVKDSIIISGDWETLDRETIKNRFTSGRLRDGLAFIAWARQGRTRQPGHEQDGPEGRGRALQRFPPKQVASQSLGCQVLRPVLLSGLAGPGSGSGGSSSRPRTRYHI